MLLLHVLQYDLFGHDEYLQDFGVKCGGTPAASGWLHASARGMHCAHQKCNGQVRLG
jgi:hypothetical protein